MSPFNVRRAGETHACAAGFSEHVGTKTTLWVMSDWTCIKLINKYPKRLEPILICVPFKFMGKPYYHERRAEVRPCPRGAPRATTRFRRPRGAACLLRTLRS